MKYFFLTIGLFAFVFDLTAQDSLYQLGPDSYLQQGVPHGKVTKYEWQSKLYNNFREYYVYVPAQYDSTRPAALMVFQDGHTYISETGDYRAPVVFDNLIFQKKIPVTICLFVNPGHNTNQYPESRWKVSNRAEEYDVLNGKYVTMLIEEIIPQLN